MTSFSEKTVRGISLLFLVIFGFLTYKNYYYSPLIVLTIMMYFSCLLYTSDAADEL